MRLRHDIIIRPVVSEKSLSGNLQDQESRKYTFLVDPRTTRAEAKQAVEAAFKVKVVKVNLLNRAGKMRRFGRFLGRKPQSKRVIVTLEKGQRIEALEGLQ